MNKHYEHLTIEECQTKAKILLELIRTTELMLSKVNLELSQPDIDIIIYNDRLDFANEIKRKLNYYKLVYMLYANDAGIDAELQLEPSKHHTTTPECEQVLSHSCIRSLFNLWNKNKL